MDFTTIVGFDWDNGNREKNLIKHSVSITEAEQVFFNIPLLTEISAKHLAKNENRYFSLGCTNQIRFLAIIFIIRERKIRVISARDMSKKERLEYEKEIKRDTDIY